MQDHLQATVTMLSLVNPAICAAMFSQIEAGRPRAAQLADSVKACVTILVILMLAALFGARVLEIFGVSLDAFKVAGGGVLAGIGFQMLRGNSSPAPAPPAPASQNTASPAGTSQPGASPAAPPSPPPSLMTLILFAASPGSITGVITLAAAQTGREIPLATLVAVAIAVAVTWCVLLLVVRVGGSGNGGLVRETATRFMGLIVVAMGVQFVLSGYRAFMATGA